MIGKTISHYRILGQVGEGGMGVVYVAEDTVLGRRVAIKIPHAGREESHYRARFLREARSVSKLKHPNIAAVYDYGETPDGQPFIVMELVSGQTLGDLLAGPGLPIARAVEIVRETAEALSEAHARGVVHRDIKPSNVIVDERGDVKVLDFGLAKQLHEDFAGAAASESQTMLSARTRSDVVIGTPLYLSPEQARGAKVDGRSDLFALGALLYECVAGRPPFSGSNVIEIGAQVLHYDPPPPSRFNPRVPPELDRSALKALAKKPEDRFQTAREFAAELERVRARLPDSDTARTRRIAVAGNGHRSSALITMAQGLRRPKFSPLALLAALVALGLIIWGVAFLRRPGAYRPGEEAAQLYRQGVDAMREGAYYKASVLLGQAVERERDFALAHARLADALMEMDFVDRAQGEMLEVGRLTPDFNIYPRDDALYLRAVYSAVQRDFADAIKDYQEIVDLNRNQPQAHLDLGRAFERNNQTDKAIGSYTEATRLDPKYAAAFLRLGSLHARVKNHAGAAAAFQSAQKLYEAANDKEGRAAVHYQRGRFLLNLGKSGDARPELEQARTLAMETNNRYQLVQALQQLALALGRGGDGEGAQKLAKEALDMALVSGMNDQVAYGHATLGTVLLLRGDLDGAEQAFNQALGFARSYKLLRYEAYALLNLGGLRENQRRLGEAEEYVNRARGFYLDGKYRKEAEACAMLIARIKRRTGDAESALKILEEHLRVAKDSDDMGSIGSLHLEYGLVLLSLDRYAEALEHFQDSESAARILRDPAMTTFSLLNRAVALWSLGHYDQAGKIFADLRGADPQSLGISNPSAVISLNEADMALSRRLFAEAAAKARQALAALKESNSTSKDLLAWAGADLGRAESSGGAAARGRERCEEAVRLASAGNDPAALARTKFALAVALLEARDGDGARAAALSAYEMFDRLGRPESVWRALVMAGKASRLAGDETAAREYLARAASSLTQLEQRLGAEAATTYLARPDVKWLRSELAAEGGAH